MIPKIAVIGAGIAGLRLAQRLAPHAHVEVFEKSRGLGGRMSTRRTPPFEFDHGAQYFTAHSDAFREFLAPYMQNGVIAIWHADRAWSADTAENAPEHSASRFVAVPTMTALCKEMAAPLLVHRATHIQSIVAGSAGWSLTLPDGQTADGFDWVLSTAPFAQTAHLMPEVVSAAANIRMQGCYSLMIGFAEAAQTRWAAIRPDVGPLAWIAANHNKPGRTSSASFVCQSVNTWADDHMEADQTEVQNMLCDAFDAATGLSSNEAQLVTLHRWRYAKVSQPAENKYFLDAQLGLGAAGDWCIGGRVEAAFESADALASSLLEQLL